MQLLCCCRLRQQRAAGLTSGSCRWSRTDAPGPCLAAPAAGWCGPVAAAGGPCCCPCCCRFDFPELWSLWSIGLMYKADVATLGWDLGRDPLVLLCGGDCPLAQWAPQWVAFMAVMSCNMSACRGGLCGRVSLCSVLAQRCHQVVLVRVTSGTPGVLYQAGGCQFPTPHPQSLSLCNFTSAPEGLQPGQHVPGWPADNARGDTKSSLTR